MKYIGKIFLAALLVTACAACTEDMDYEPGGVTPVKQLLLPADNYYVALQSSATETLAFAWSPATADDGMKPHYEVVFMAAAGGEVLYRYDAGFDTRTAVSHKDLNKIAGACGIKTGTTGEVMWSVVSSRAGERSEIVAPARELTIKRLNGFEEIPTELYLLGDGTDAGDRALRCLEGGADGGEYTVYTRLEAGKNYYFTSTVDEGKTPRTFAIDANGIIVESETPSTADKTGIFRLFLDFNTRAVTVTEINRVQLFQCSQGTSSQDFAYAGRGVWKASDIETAEGDDRYLFHTWTDGSGNWNEKWASRNWDNASAPSAGSAADFWSVYPQTDRLNDAWGYSYKWIHAEWDTKKTVDVEIRMNLDDYDSRPFFYHTVSYK